VACAPSTNTPGRANINRDPVERVAAPRRELPLGGNVPEDYLFERIMDFAVARGWTRVQLLPSSKNSYMLDLTPEGLGTDGYPKLEYAWTLARHVDPTSPYMRSMSGRSVQ